VFKQKLAQST
jgi:WD40 repeat protein